MSTLRLLLSVVLDVLSEPALYLGVGAVLAAAILYHPGPSRNDDL